MNLLNLGIIAAVFVYIFSAIAFFRRRSKEERAIRLIERREGPRLFFWERSIIDRLYIHQSYVRAFVYTIRTALVLVALGGAYFLGTIIFVIAACTVIAMFMNRRVAALIYEAGIEHIALLNAFLDSYVPSIASGMSNDQAMLKYINSIEDEGLFEWWVNKDDPQYKPEAKWRRVIEIYNIVRYNEERGIDNSLPIIEQMQKDLAVKQEFYNNYRAKMGEINPITISYYVFVPILLLVSLTQARGFWFSGWGALCSVLLIILFAGSQFMIYKIKENAIKTIF